ncbi:unnamed protein product [Urochloa humidicola]
MSVPLPPLIFPPIVFPPPPPNPPPPPWSPPPKSVGGVIAGVSVAAGIILFLVSCIYTLIRGQHQSAADAAAAEAAAPDQPQPTEGEPWRASATAAGLPSFTYDRSVKHNVTDGCGGGGEEAATCSVCLAAFQDGETVRLLPVCLHLYHVECIDPWLDAHSSCPICRTGTDPAVDGGLLPPV